MSKAIEKIEEACEEKKRVINLLCRNIINTQENLEDLEYDLTEAKEDLADLEYALVVLQQ